MVGNVYAGISSVVVLFMYVYCTQTGTSTQNHCNCDKQTSKQTCGGTFKPIGTVFLVYLDPGKNKHFFIFFAACTYLPPVWLM